MVLNPYLLSWAQVVKAFHGFIQKILILLQAYGMIIELELSEGHVQAYTILEELHSGKKANLKLGEEHGYNPLLLKIVDFFNTGIVPVKPEETLEIYAFMEAAEESKLQNGASVNLESVMVKAKSNVKLNFNI